MPQVFEEVEMTSNTWISSKEALRWACQTTYKGNNRY